MLQSYPKSNNGHHTEPSDLYVCSVKVSKLDNFVTPFLIIKTTYRQLNFDKGWIMVKHKFLSNVWIMMILRTLLQLVLSLVVGVNIIRFSEIRG